MIAVALQPIFEIRPVDIRGKEIERGCSRAVDFQVDRMRAAAWVLSRTLQRRGQLRIHEHRQPILTLSCRRHLTDVAGVDPSHERLGPVIAKDAVPSAPAGVPGVTDFRWKPNLPCAE